MTRGKQKRRLAVVVICLLTLIAVALAAKLTDGNTTLAKLYDFIKDTSLLVATVAVAYLANLYQKREQFLQSLRDQWREIVQAKTSLVFYCEVRQPSLINYLAALRDLSECIDTMRIVYANVGETEHTIGLFPYAPLHRMRHVMERLDPRVSTPVKADYDTARTEIWDAFTAIREHFLDEFDIEEPARPILIHTMKRGRKPGHTARAERLLQQQTKAALEASLISGTQP